MIACKGHRVIACMGVALSGLGALASILSLEYSITFLKASLALLSFSTLILLPENSMVSYAIIALTIGALLGIKAFSTPIPLVIPLVFILLASLKTPRLEAILAGFNSILAFYIAYTDDILPLAMFITLQSILAVTTTRKLHSIVLIIALATIPFGITPAIIASLLITILVISASGFIEKTECPFKVDSKLTLSGSLIGGAGVIMAAFQGWEPLTGGVWVLGFLLAMIGTLVPSKSAVKHGLFNR